MEFGISLRSHKSQKPVSSPDHTKKFSRNHWLALLNFTALVWKKSKMFLQPKNDPFMTISLLQLSTWGKNEILILIHTFHLYLISSNNMIWMINLTHSHFKLWNIIGRGVHFSNLIWFQLLWFDFRVVANTVFGFILWSTTNTALICHISWLTDFILGNFDFVNLFAKGLT